MRIDIITVLPEMIEGFFNCSIMKRAQDKGLAEIHIHNLRDYTEDKYRRVDDYPFGGFAGMVMKIEPIERCINALKAERDYDEVISVSYTHLFFTVFANACPGTESRIGIEWRRC